jgi:hypothetical protein
LREVTAEVREEAEASGRDLEDELIAPRYAFLDALAADAITQVRELARAARTSSTPSCCIPSGASVRSCW